MELELNWSIILFFILGLVLLYIVGWVLAFPLKFILKFLTFFIIGAAMLVLLSNFGEKIGVSLAINPLNMLIAGAFGLPGILLILLIKLIFC